MNTLRMNTSNVTDTLLRILLQKSKMKFIMVVSKLKTAWDCDYQKKQFLWQLQERFVPISIESTRLQLLFLLCGGNKNILLPSWNYNSPNNVSLEFSRNALPRLFWNGKNYHRASQNSVTIWILRHLCGNIIIKW